MIAKEWLLTKGAKGGIRFRSYEEMFVACRLLNRGANTEGGTKAVWSKGVLAALLAASVFADPCAVQAGSHVVFTVDVESQALALPEQVDAVCHDGSACGLMEIARMLKERGMAGTFFLNVYEYARWGEPAMRDIAVKLLVAGQDVALHTHPETAYDPIRTEMYQYSLEEQTAIIREGVELLRSWTGRPVVAHRAGDYSADENTLEALKRNGLRLDSSFFWGHPRCRLTGLGLPRNFPASLGPLTEIPVTVYQRQETPLPFGNIFAPVASVRKVDVDWFLDENEARSGVDCLIEAGVPFVVVFLHSFSLLTASGDGRAPLADRHSLDIFRAILDRVAEKRLPVVTMRDLAESGVVIATSEDQDVLPRVTVRVGLGRYLWHRLVAAGTPAWIVGVLVLMFVAVGVLIASRRGRTAAADTVNHRRGDGRSAN